jgi:hypothetical protein
MRTQGHVVTVWGICRRVPGWRAWLTLVGRTIHGQPRGPARQGPNSVVRCHRGSPFFPNPRSICLFSPSVYSCDVLRRPSLDASLSASSSFPPKNCPLSRSRMGPLGLRMDFGRRLAGFRWPRGAASGPKSRRAPPLLCGGRGSVPRGSVARSGEVSDGGADAFFLTPGPGSRARAWLTISVRP